MRFGCRRDESVEGKSALSEVVAQAPCLEAEIRPWLLSRLIESSRSSHGLGYQYVVMKAYHPSCTECRKRLLVGVGKWEGTPPASPVRLHMHAWRFSPCLPTAISVQGSTGMIYDTSEAAKNDQCLHASPQPTAAAAGSARLPAEWPLPQAVLRQDSLDSLSQPEQATARTTDH